MPKQFGTPGPRAIYPDICTSRTIAAVSIRAQLLFDRLIAQADDQGRVEGDASIVKAICVPLIAEFTARTVETSLQELVGRTLIVRYKADGHDLIQIVTWWRWQAGMRRAYPSRYPPPAEWNDVIFGLGDDTPKTYRDAVGLLKGARKLPADLPADSPQPARKLPAERGELPTLAGARLPAPAQPLPVPSAGAGAGAREESGSSDVVYPPPSPKGPVRVNGFTTPGDVVPDDGDWASAMTRSERDAWSGFGPEWSAFRAAWLRRGLRRPPHGSAEDDPDDPKPSQRALLFSILDARPHDLPRWVSDAPAKASASQVVAHCLERWHAERDRAVDRAAADESAWEQAKAAERDEAARRHAEIEAAL